MSKSHGKRTAPKSAQEPLGKSLAEEFESLWKMTIESTEVMPDSEEEIKAGREFCQRNFYAGAVSAMMLVDTEAGYHWVMDELVEQLQKEVQS